jgi:predicted MFS family arabinose efflux permease
MLAGSRALQGVFAALLAPAVLSILSTTFTDPKERNRAFGIYGGVLAAGASVGLLLGGVLTEWLDWRAVMYVNVPIAIIAVAAAMRFLVNQVQPNQPRIDIAGAVTVSLGLFLVVFGFSNAETSGWGDSVTVGSLVAGIALLVSFIVIESRVAHPLLPLRVLKDWNRGGAYLTMAIAAIAMFGTFLFLTYNLQGIMGYSPVRTGAAFLPMTIVLMVTAIVSSTRLRPLFGPRALVATGMALGAVGMVYLTRLGVDAAYMTDILPALLVEGLGLGLVFSTASNNSTLGVLPADAGVASATTNASQQIGGSLGAALLSTVAATATADYLASHAATSDAVAQATVHGFTTGFAWSAAIFAVGAVVALLTFRKNSPSVVAEVSNEPVLVH